VSIAVIVPSPFLREVFAGLSAFDALVVRTASTVSTLLRTGRAIRCGAPLSTAQPRASSKRLVHLRAFAAHPGPISDASLKVIAGF